MRIKVTGYFEPEDDEIDEDDDTGLTEEAFERYTDAFQLDDMTFKPAS